MTSESNRDADTPEVLRYSVNLITQGKHRFYSITIPSDILAQICFVTTRDEDPISGFQRTLDKKRAGEIAKYIDDGLGTIPSAIILSAQPSANFKVIGGSKTAEFRKDPKAFFVIDGQHRLYGFHLAKTSLRVPVIIYNGLSRADEAKVFIDVNSKQKPVPNELLLDIKNLAEYENNSERIMREIYDFFQTEPDSILLGLTSPNKPAKGKISRVTFNSAVKPLVRLFSGMGPREIYRILNAYLAAISKGENQITANGAMLNPILFRAYTDIFMEVAQRVKDRYGTEYKVDHFYEVVIPMFSKIRSSVITSPNNSYKEVSSDLLKALKTDFSIL